MTKLGVFTVLAAIYVGVSYFARFMLSLLIIIFCGFATYEIVSNFRKSTKAGAASIADAVYQRS